jgi:hypothetical protein
MTLLVSLDLSSDTATTTFLRHSVGVSADYDARNARFEIAWVCHPAHTSFRPRLLPRVPGWLRVPDRCNVFLTVSWRGRSQLQQDQLLDSCSGGSRSVEAAPAE